MNASKPSSSTNAAPATLPHAEPTPAAAETKPIYRILQDCYGLKKGDHRTAEGLFVQGVTPDFMIDRKFAELVV